MCVNTLVADGREETLVDLRHNAVAVADGEDGSAGGTDRRCSVMANSSVVAGRWRKLLHDSSFLTHSGCLCLVQAW